MTNNAPGSCHEIAIFRGATGASMKQVLAALRGVEPWLTAQPGFLCRAIRYDAANQLWIDVVEWESRDKAISAMRRAGEDPNVGALGAVIEPATMQMLHGDLVPPV
jgi:hypothetical protein